MYMQVSTGFLINIMIIYLHIYSAISPIIRNVFLNTGLASQFIINLVTKILKWKSKFSIEKEMKDNYIFSLCKYNNSKFLYYPLRYSNVNNTIQSKNYELL